MMSGNLWGAAIVGAGAANIAVAANPKQCPANINSGAINGYATTVYTVSAGPQTIPYGSSPVLVKPPVGSAQGVTLGNWIQVEYPSTRPTTGPCSCDVTYTCYYGQGYNEVSAIFQD
jgi:hypothetical protein